MTIGLDFDDVLFDFAEAFCLFSRNRYGSSILKKDIAEYGMEIAWKCTAEEMAGRIQDFYESKEHVDAIPVEGSTEGVRMLAEKMTSM